MRWPRPRKRDLNAVQMPSFILWEWERHLRHYSICLSTSSAFRKRNRKWRYGFRPFCAKKRIGACLSVFLVRKTGLELRTSGVYYGVKKGKPFSPLFRFLADFVGILQAKPQTEVRLPPVLREKEQVGDCLPAFYVKRDLNSVQAASIVLGARHMHFRRYSVYLPTSSAFRGYYRKTVNGGTGSRPFVRKKSR